jgi:hypothetical protein
LEAVAVTSTAKEQNTSHRIFILNARCRPQHLTALDNGKKVVNIEASKKCVLTGTA